MSVTPTMTISSKLPANHRYRPPPGGRGDHTEEIPVDPEKRTSLSEKRSGLVGLVRIWIGIITVVLLLTLGRGSYGGDAGRW